MTASLDAELARHLKQCTETILSVSTGHIPRRTADALGQEDSNRCANAALWDVLAYEPWADYGWIIYAGEVPEEVRTEHPELARLIDLARENGFYYLRLDCDANTLPEELGYPSLEW